jgi:ribosomal protein S18 acetylase RimI-like enzyme
MTIEIREVAFGSDEYRLACALRDVVLRRPLGLELSAEDVAGEARQLHLLAFDEVGLVGCLLLVPGESSEIKMRQVAIAVRAQRRGVGSALVARAEAVGRERGFGVMVLHARRAAVPFYERLGYRVEGPEFVEVTIPHSKMKKWL